MSIPLKHVVALLCAASIITAPLTATAESTEKKTAVVADFKDVSAISLPPATLGMGAFGRSFVSVGPYVGTPSVYNGSSLIINAPSVNTDVQLLNIRKARTKSILGAGGSIEEEYPHVVLSGIIESQIILERFDHVTSSDINVTNMSLDAAIFGPSNWLLGLVELTYDPGIDSNVDSGFTQFRTAHSRVFVNKAFVTVGDFNQSPFYGSLGQYYVPFGTYATVMVSDPFTKLLARTKARAILLGFQQQDTNAFYASGYAYSGDTGDKHNYRINDGGVNVGYKFTAGMVSGNVGGGYIGNLANSAGMQLGNGFASSLDNEKLEHHVPAYNVRAMLSVGEHINLLGEFVGATKRFARPDMSFNDHGARPAAWDVEAAYSFDICNKPSNVGLDYGGTTQALSLGLPKTRYAAVFNTSIFRNTLQSLEFRRDHFYGKGTTATMAGNEPAPSGKNIYDNLLTAQLDYYF